MNNELYPSSFKNQSLYRNSIPSCDYSTFTTFKPQALIAQSSNGQLPISDLLKQKQQLNQQKHQMKSNSFLQSIKNENLSRPAVQSNSSNNKGMSNSNSNNKIILRSKSPPPKVPQRNSSQLVNNKRLIVDQSDVSPLWRSKSFAGGLQQNQQLQDDQFYDYTQQVQKNKINLRQAPITYANPLASNRNTIHLGKQSDDKIYGLNNNVNNNNNLSPCNQSCCQNLNSNKSDQTKTHHINKVNDEISQRYLAAENFNPMNGLNKMRHSQSHHSYLSTKAPVQQINSFNTGTLPNSVSYHGQPLNKPKQPVNSLDASSLSSIGSSGSGSLTRSSAFLSQRYASVGNLSHTRKFFSALSLGTKNNRNPQPQRSLLIFSSIEKGLRECICLTQEDISQLKTAIGNGVQLSSAQQYKNAERYLKRLNYQLAKIEELRDQYEMHMKLSDGVRSMASAYAFSPGKEKEVALSSVRNELKEYIQTMGIVESELEQSMGSFLLQMQGIQGFARLCAGDVFEITIKCGEKQKWKVKGKILKDNVQSWCSTEKIFRPNLLDQLSIKAVELRGLGKKICLGSKNCEIKDLFSARPQLMSICLNTTGTLKLHLIVTWNPLHETKTTINGALSNSIQGSSLINGTTLTKSKSFTASSSSLFSRFKSSTNNSSTYSTLNLNNPIHHSFGQSFNNALFNRTLSDNKRCTLPSGFEIIDADYYHHPHLIAEANKQEQLNKRLTIHGLPTITNPVSRVNSMLVSSNALKHNNRHSYAGFNHTSLSPIHSPNLRTEKDEEDTVDNKNKSNNDEGIKQKVLNNNKIATSDNKCQQSFKQTVLTANVDGMTPSSTGSKGSSLHLTGTTSSGFCSSGSSSSYSSVPNSTLTSPDNESAPSSNKVLTANKASHIISDSNNSSPIQCDVYDCGHCGTQTNNTEQKRQEQPKKKQTENLNSNSNKKNSIVVEATVHQNPSESINKNKKYPLERILSEDEITQQMCRSTSMPVQLSNGQLQHQQQRQQIMIKNQHDQKLTANNRTDSMDTLTTPDILYQSPNFFNVGDTLINLMSSLEDIQGQFSELHSLQGNVINLYKVLCQISKLRIINSNLQNIQTQQTQRVRRSSDGSNISVSVESALECFDFLNSLNQANTDSEVDSVVCTPEHRQTKTNENQINKNSVTAENDSFVSNPCPTPSPYLKSTQQLSAGSDQIDIALMSHLIYCQRLIENLGAFGPLRSREQSSLAKLQLQAQAVERLVRVCVNLRDYLQVRIELHKDNQLKQYPMDLALELENLYAQFKQQQDIELTNCFGNDTRIAKLWNFVCYLHTAGDHDNEQLTQIDLGNSNNKQNIALGNILLCCTSAGFALCLEKFMHINNLVPATNNSTLNGNSTLGKLSISMSNLTGLALSTTDANSYNASSNKKLKGNELTSKISQLITKRLIDAPNFEDDFVVSLYQLCIFFQNENSSLEHMFKAYAQEVQLLNSIQSNDVIEIEQSLKQFKKTLPPKEPLYSICLLLLDSDELIIRISEQYFLNASKNRSMRTAILNQLLDALQNDNSNLRQAACLAIALLSGTEYLNQLVFVCTVDSNPEVRNQAKQTLLALGNEGKQMYLDSQRYNHGFQGLIVK